MTDSTPRSGGNTSIDLTQVQDAAPSGTSSHDVLVRTVAETVLGVHGVRRLGNSLGHVVRTVGARVSGGAAVPGVTVTEEGERPAIAVSIVVDYPENVLHVVEGVRKHVGHAVNQLTASAFAIDITVSDLHTASDADAEPDADTSTDTLPASTARER